MSVNKRNGIIKPCILNVACTTVVRIGCKLHEVTSEKFSRTVAEFVLFLRMASKLNIWFAKIWGPIKAKHFCACHPKIFSLLSNFKVLWIRYLMVFPPSNVKKKPVTVREKFSVFTSYSSQSILTAILQATLRIQAFLCRLFYWHSLKMNCTGVCPLHVDWVLFFCHAVCHRETQ